MADKHVVGAILGTAVGDALGLPYEGLSRDRALRLLGPPDRHRFFLGRGMLSDDTEHTCMVAQSLIEAGGDMTVFRRRFAYRLRVWLLGVPAGVGFATLRALLRLWIGYNPESSGVFSAGNGPAMRAPILGAAISDPALLREFVRASTRITHTDPRAEYGALAVALAAQTSASGTRVSGAEYLAQVESAFQGKAGEMMALLSQAVDAVSDGSSTEAFAERLGLSRGVSGYVNHTVPVAIHAWLSHPGDYRSAVSAVIRCGGDADTTAAIVGGIVGAEVGEEGIPAEWLDGIFEWPRSVAWLRRLGAQLGATVKSGVPCRAVETPFVLVVLRNLFFLAIVLAHGFRRLAPPY
ncbi:MAG: ADP-ribosylglycohydrolase family protein [Candidatus Hydrogenedentes bacterium]|nr:ADP-ribosylglycohydrolase family protein [Candidatus Hydrogenedentota bacterium]